MRVILAESQPRSNHLQVHPAPVQVRRTEAGYRFLHGPDGSKSRNTYRRTVMKKFVIERKIDGVGRMNDRELSGAAGTSNRALAQLAPKVQWVHSYVTADRTFCIYLAEDESQVHEHARISGFPAT